MLLTLEQAAKHAQVDRRTIRKLIDAGRLRAIDFGDRRRRCYRIDPADLQALATAKGEPQLTPPRKAHRLDRRRAPVPASIHAYLPPA